MVFGNDGSGLCKTQLVTSIYSAPETISGTAYKSELADIFSAGMILFTMMAGTSPFKIAKADKCTCFKNFQLGNFHEFWKSHDSKKLIFSQEAREFLQLLMSTDPCKRASMDTIKANKWFNEPLPSQEQVVAEFITRKADMIEEQLKFQKKDEVKLQSVNNGRLQIRRSFKSAASLTQRSQEEEDKEEESEHEIKPKRQLMPYYSEAPNPTSFLSKCTPSALLDRLCSELNSNQFAVQVHDRKYKLTASSTLEDQNFTSFNVSIALDEKTHLLSIEFTKAQGNSAQFYSVFKLLRRNMADMEYI